MDADIDWINGTVRICAVGAPPVDCDSEAIHGIHHGSAAVVHKQAHRHPSRADMISQGYIHTFQYPICQHILRAFKGFFRSLEHKPNPAGQHGFIFF